MRYIINSQFALSRSPEGPLADHIVSFAQFLSEQGYGLFSMRNQVLLAACFSRWLGQNEVGVHSICAEQSARYLRYRARYQRPKKGDRPAFRHLLDFLRREGLIPPELAQERRLTPAEQHVESYVQHLRRARALAEPTIINYVPFIRAFLKDCFGRGPIAFSRLRAGDVVRFVRHQAPRMHVKRAKSLTTALRSFFQYLRLRGEITADRAAAVPAVANWSMSAIPRGITPGAVRKLLDSVDRRTTTGRRDYAILLLLARLGLRSGEVVSLELDDIDWTAGQLSVRGKGGHRSELPLSADVGKAIAAYLQQGRPRSTSRRVFLRTKAPIDGFRGSSSLGCVVRRSLKRAGVDAPTTGSHQFRHGLATEMLRQGASLNEIGEVLGHHHPQTTTIYAKVALKALRTLALPWPGDAR
jgi:integrase/recombinase XerD